ncbi:hypothetical protein CYMTET_18099 [Cymbomonas tetramitiformis]|uniref:Uncharacterized protein n=1 Tax=Cymbomonas tetramitiformis TaxID=36881 RepID=A0AAE0G935_9CHLO|nr:hypothetical protein CYMTET_18099 [Cymbomonas tetramitiformis]
MRAVSHGPLIAVSPHTVGGEQRCSSPRAKFPWRDARPPREILALRSSSNGAIRRKRGRSDFSVVTAMDFQTSFRRGPRVPPSKDRLDVHVSSCMWQFGVDNHVLRAAQTYLLLAASADEELWVQQVELDKTLKTLLRLLCVRAPQLLTATWLLPVARLAAFIPQEEWERPLGEWEAPPVEDGGAAAMRSLQAHLVERFPAPRSLEVALSFSDAPVRLPSSD